LSARGVRWPSRPNEFEHSVFHSSTRSSRYFLRARWRLSELPLPLPFHIFFSQRPFAVREGRYEKNLLPFDRHLRARRLSRGVTNKKKKRHSDARDSRES
jgi:hypothetical protein